MAGECPRRRIPLVAGSHACRARGSLFIPFTLQHCSREAGQTTAHTLGFALALLALHQDEQEKLHEQIKSLLPDGELPVSSTFRLLTVPSNDRFIEILRSQRLYLCQCVSIQFQTYRCTRSQSIPSVLYETLRMFPSVILIPKYAAEETTLTTVDSMGGSVELNLPKGSHVSFDTTALHHNRTCSSYHDLLH